ncbi:hypothetical protein J6590_015226 [Homalodisca vitripennis]|nr:hypothetical protein J6590_015226 [Homalodisca vitripennis]
MSGNPLSTLGNWLGSCGRLPLHTISRGHRCNTILLGALLKRCNVLCQSGLCKRICRKSHLKLEAIEASVIKLRFGFVTYSKKIGSKLGFHSSYVTLLFARSHDDNYVSGYGDRLVKPRHKMVDLSVAMHSSNNLYRSTYV